MLIVPFAIFRISGSLRGFGHAGEAATAVHLAAADAKNHVGADAVVTGTVTGVHLSAAGTLFLDFGAAYPNQDFTAVIFARDRSRFPAAGRMSGRLVQVTGRIDRFHSRPEMILRRPGQLRILN